MPTKLTELHAKKRQTTSELDLVQRAYTKTDCHKRDEPPHLLTFNRSGRHPAAYLHRLALVHGLDGGDGELTAAERDERTAYQRDGVGVRLARRIRLADGRAAPAAGTCTSTGGVQYSSRGRAVHLLGTL